MAPSRVSNASSEGSSAGDVSMSDAPAATSRNGGYSNDVAMAVSFDLISANRLDDTNAAFPTRRLNLKVCTNILNGEGR